MTHDEAFLQAVLDEPQDDDVRLIYADWLEEQGNPRGEFIRLQVRLAEYPPHRRPSALTQRERELLEEHEADWARDIQPLVRSWSFRRGFVDRVDIDVVDFRHVLHDLFRLTPVEELRLMREEDAAVPDGLVDEMALLNTDPAVRFLHTLDLSGVLLNNWELQNLCAWPCLPRLRHLDLSNNRVGDAGVRVLAMASFFTQLVTLELADNAITAQGVMVLGEMLRQVRNQGESLRLETLDLRGNRLSTAARREIARDPTLKAVTVLDMPAQWAQSS